MKISEIRIKLMEDTSDRLRAFCSVTIDECFVIRDLKIIDGSSGPFVAMPSRKLTGNCTRCHHKNHLRANYCNHCGAKQSVTVSGNNPQKLYADIAHPINSACREVIQTAVLEEFDSELARAGEPGYRSRYDDGFDDAGESVDVDDMIAVHDREPSGDDRSVEIDAGETAVRPPRLDRQRPPRESSVSDRDATGNADDDTFGRGIF